MFIYTGNNKQIELAVNRSNDLDIQGDLAGLIEDETFDMSTVSSDYLSAEFIDYIKNTDIFVKTYHKRWTKALAYFSSSRPRDININTAKLNRTNGSIVGTFYHEAAHMCDHDDKVQSFGHGSNSSVGKQNTFPYKVGSLVQSTVDGSLPDFNNNENANIKTVVSPCESVKRFFRGLL